MEKRTIELAERIYERVIGFDGVGQDADTIDEIVKNSILNAVAFYAEIERLERLVRRA